MKDLINNLKKSSNFARDWRNKRISHNDASLILNENITLKNASRLKVKEAISDIHSIIAYVQKEFIGVENYGNVIPDLGGASSLLITLYHGVDQQEKLSKSRNDSEYKAPAYPPWLLDTQ